MSDYYEDEWYEDEVYGEETDDFAHVAESEGDDEPDFYTEQELSCPFCMGPCGNCEAVHDELAGLSPEDRENYANFWRSVLMDFAVGGPIPLPEELTFRNEGGGSDAPNPFERGDVWTSEDLSESEGPASS